MTHTNTTSTTTQPNTNDESDGLVRRDNIARHEVSVADIAASTADGATRSNDESPHTAIARSEEDAMIERCLERWKQAEEKVSNSSDNEEML